MKRSAIGWDELYLHLSHTIRITNTWILLVNIFSEGHCSYSRCEFGEHPPGTPHSYEVFDVTKNLPKVELFPVLWADEGADLDTTNAEKFKDAIVKPTNIVLGLSIALGMVLGAVLVVVGIICLRRRRSQAYQEPVRISSVTKTH